MEAQHNKEKKILRQEKLKMEENYKVLEELVSEGSPELTMKLEETEKKVASLEQQSKSKDAELSKMRTQLKSTEIKCSEAQAEKDRHLTESKDKDAKLQQLANVVCHLERALATETAKAKSLHEGGKFKDLYEEESRKRKDTEEKLKVATENSKAKEKFVKMQDRINELKKQAKMKLCEKEVENRKLNETLKEKDKEISIQQEKANFLEKEIASLRIANNEEIHTLKLNNAKLERENDELKNSLADQKSSIAKSSFEYSNKLEETERKHFKQVNDLQNKVQHLEGSKLDELSKLEDEWIQKMAIHTSSSEKLKIKLKVSEDMTRKTQVDKETLQADLNKVYLNIEDLKKEKAMTDKKMIHLEGEVVNKESEKEALVSRCEEAEKRLADSSERILATDRINSQRLQLEYQINFWKEKAQRLENGVTVPACGSPDLKNEPAPEVDENELFLRFLDIDTKKMMEELNSKISERDLVIEKMTSESTETNNVMESMLTKEDVWSVIQELCASFSPVGVSCSLHNSIVHDLTRKLEIKESEVLWANSEVEEKRRKVEELENEVEKSKSAHEAVPPLKKESSRLAFMQCGIPGPDTEKTDCYIESEEQIRMLQRTIEAKEDHFSREIEVLKSRNKVLQEKILNSSLESNVDFKEEHQKLLKDYENLMKDSTSFSQKELQLKDSIRDLEDLIKSRNEELDKEKEAGTVLNESLEIEKTEVEAFRAENVNLRQEMAVLLGRVQAFEEKEKRKGDQVGKEKKLNVEIKTLNSENERLRCEVLDVKRDSKEKVKAAQEATIRAHEGLFAEHETILETIKSFSSRKRKRFFENVYETSKKLRNEESPVKSNYDQSVIEEGDSMLLDDTIEPSLSDPKEFISSVIKSPFKNSVTKKTKVVSPESLVVRCPVKDAVLEDTELLDLEKIEFIVDQQVGMADIDTNSINLDDAEFVLQDDSTAIPTAASAAPPKRDIPSSAATVAAPTKILQVSWV